MLPCSKSTNGVYAARYLKHAERNARSIQINAGVKRNIMDGCIIEGKRIGSLLKATVIEPTGEIFGLAANFNPPPNNWYMHRLTYFAYPCGTREPYHSGFPSLELLNTDINTQRGPSYDGSARVFGRDIFPENVDTNVFSNMTQPVYHLATENFIYAVQYAYDKTAQREKYLRVIATKTASSQSGRFDGNAVFIHSSQVRIFTGEYGIDTLAYYAQRSKAIEVSEGVIAIIAVVGKVIETIPPIDPAMPESSVTLYRETLVRLDVDLKIKENREKKIELGKDYDPIRDRIKPTLTGMVFPQHLMPSDLDPKTVKRWEGEGEDRVIIDVAAKTAMTIADIALDEDGNVIAAIKYQVKVQTGPEPEAPYADQARGEDGITVVAYGLASWGGASSFFNIQSKEVFTEDGNHPLVAAHGANPVYVLLDNSTNIINGKIVRTAAKVSRLAMSYVAYQANPSYIFRAPYIVEIVDGVEKLSNDGDPVMGLAYGGAGLQYAYGFAVDYERDFYIHSNWAREVNNGNKAYVSKTAVAVPASGAITLVSDRFIKSTDQGILFIDGDKRRYEQLSLAPSTVEQQHITITCHQKEVRDIDGKLIFPCVLVVGAYINGKHSILVRKGPVWDDDFDEAGYNFERYWKVTKATNNNFNFYFYRGNPLMPAGKYGQFFKLYAEGK